MILVKANQLRERIIKAGLTQSDFSKKIGVTPGFISQLLNRRKNISAPAAKRTTEVLECSFDEIFEIFEEKGA